MKKIYFLSIFFAMGLTLLATPHAYSLPAANVMKWHPGHYYTLIMPSNDKYEDSYLSQVYSELNATPMLRGAQIRYHWKDLEPEEGKYNFAKMDKHLAGLALHKKRLVVLIQIKSFSKDGTLATAEDVVPPYIKTSTYDGGQIAFTSSLTGLPHGYLIKLWNPKIRARIDALLKALGDRYNSHDYFEAIGFTESSAGTNLTATQQVDYYNGLNIVDQSARTHFPNTIVYQFTNHTRKYLETFIMALKNMGASLGGPDILPTDQSLTFSDSDPKTPDGVYTYYPKLAGIVPLMPSVQPIDYRYTSAKKSEPGHVPTLQELYDFGKNNLKANYIYWTRDVEYYAKVLEFLKKPSIASTTSGGLSATCPSNFSSCVESLSSSSGDTTKPTVSITSPSSGALITSSVNVNVSADDNIGVTKVELYANGTLKDTLLNSPFNFTYAPSTNGNILLVARAYDAAGNTQDSAGIQIQEQVTTSGSDTTAPTITISNPLNGAIISAGKTSIWIKTSAEDTAGIKSIKLLINGVLKDTTKAGSVRLNFEWFLSNVPAGFYTIKVIATDNNDNIRSKSIQVEVRR